MSVTSRIPQELLDRIKRHPCILFIGSEISIEASDLSVENELAIKLSQDGNLCNCKFLGGDKDCEGRGCCCHWPLRRISQYYEIRFGRLELINKIDAFFRERKEPSLIYEKIARLSAISSTLVTTNIERRLERLLDSLGKEYTLVLDDNELPYGDNRLIIIKLFGCLSRKTSLMLTEEHQTYEYYLRSKSLIVDKLTAYLSGQQPIIFLGFDLENDLILNIFERVSGRQGSHKAPSYAIKRTPNDYERRNWEKKGVRFIDCDVLSFLEELEASLDPKIIALSDKLTIGALEYEKQGKLLEREILNNIRDNFDLLVSKQLIAPNLQKLILYSAMHLDEYPSWVFGRITNQSLQESTVLELLKSQDHYAQANAADLASSLNLRKVVNDLIDLLVSPSKKVRIAASGAISQIGDNETASILLDHSREERFGIFALKTFCYLDPKFSIPEFEKYFSHGSTEIKREILKQLGRLQKNISDEGITRGKETIIECAHIAMHDTNREFFGWALQILAASKLPLAAIRLRDFVLLGNNKRREEQAIDALGKLKIRKSIECLGILLQEANWIRDNAFHTIREFLNPFHVEEDDELRLMCVKALIESKYRATETLKLLGELTRDYDARIRGEVFHILPDYFEEDEFSRILDISLSDPDEAIKQDALVFMESRLSVDKIFKRLYDIVDITVNVEGLPKGIDQLLQYSSLENWEQLIELLQKLIEAQDNEPSHSIKVLYTKAINNILERLYSLDITVNVEGLPKRIDQLLQYASLENWEQLIELLQKLIEAQDNEPSHSVKLVYNEAISKLEQIFNDPKH